VLYIQSEARQQLQLHLRCFLQSLPLLLFSQVLLTTGAGMLAWLHPMLRLVHLWTPTIC
jgi:hypothetical protein